MPANHKNVAIMFTDIVGYTAMMGQNEAEALELVTYYEDCIKDVTNANQGDVINFYGDGSLCTFDKTEHAIKAATEIQQNFQTHRHVPLRVGIHHGDAIFQNDNVYGDAVNIASRIESMGQAGAVLISEIANQTVESTDGIEVEELGTYEFKNVEAPMRIYALAHEGLAIPDKATITGKFKSQNSMSLNKAIAVLPFQNVSSDASQQIFIDGISDEIRSQLLGVEGLKVIARSSSVVYNASSVNLSEVASKLQVGYVLEGRVHVMGDRVRMHIELSHTSTNKQVWSMPSVEIDIEELPLIQNDIALSVVKELRVMLSEGEKTQLSTVSTTNQDALRAYQKGMDSMHRGHGKEQELAEAVQCFEEAVALDPGFSKAYIGMADAYLEYVFWGRAPAKEVLSLAEKAAQKALELDENNGEANGVMGAINFFNHGPVEDSIRNLEKAIELSPSYLGAYEKLGWIHAFLQNMDEAKRLMIIAQGLDPLSTKYIGDLAQAYYYNCRFDEGLAYIEPHRMAHPKDPWLLWMNAYLLTGKGDYEAALDLLSQRSTSGKKSNFMLGYNYGKLGMEQEARAILNFLIQKSMLDFVPALMIAVIYMGLGEEDEALSWLEKDVEQGGQGILFKGLPFDVKFQELRGNPQFDTVVELARLK